MSNDKEEDQAAAKLLQISQMIDSLEGLPVDYSLARRLAEISRDIRESVNVPEGGQSWSDQTKERCRKVPHIGEGYLHTEDDDRPYDVDGVLYCGRCHGFYGRMEWGTMSPPL
jgi:hypothetical protein